MKRFWCQTCLKPMSSSLEFFLKIPSAPSPLGCIILYLALQVRGHLGGTPACLSGAGDRVAQWLANSSKLCL